MTASYTFDVFSTLDAFGSPSPGSWGGYWGKQGPELLEHRLASYGEQQRMVFGADTYRLFAQFLASGAEESEVHDRMGHPDVEHAGNGGIDHPERTPRLARRDRRER